jgi:hypothetical protein
MFCLLPRAFVFPLGVGGGPRKPSLWVCPPPTLCVRIPSHAGRRVLFYGGYALSCKWAWVANPESPPKKKVPLISNPGLWKKRKYNPKCFLNFLCCNPCSPETNQILSTWSHPRGGCPRGAGSHRASPTGLHLLFYRCLLCHGEGRGRARRDRARQLPPVRR